LLPSGGRVVFGNSGSLGLTPVSLNQ
jgi:hypothetical protein